ncbi:DUF1643 domain-containing protein [Thalassotalea sp. PS06]|uniref:DUF1643 domain-containing protein n=1 Tax=Thalassotalea sp. PS06 TaxID=2594005 RepID=UPI001C8F5827|nr:DUF1643 domain-containing protein [Thalassotalea sp. PS06]
MAVTCTRKVKQTKFRMDGVSGLLTLHDNGTVAVSQSHKNIFTGLDYLEVGSYYEIRKPDTKTMTVIWDRLFGIPTDVQVSVQERVSGDATISSCGDYRYLLDRQIDPNGKTVIAYIGMNPSTADATTDDNTLKNWQAFARRYGAKKILVGNCFGYRSTDVKKLSHVHDPIGPENDHYLEKIIEQADILVPCWGSKEKLITALRYRLENVLKLLIDSGKPVKVLGFTESGDPRHPQGISYDTEFIDYVVGSKK